jgi:predicted MPP superfamily phosphohydrolase
MLLKLCAITAITFTVLARYSDRMIDTTSCEVVSSRLPAAFNGFRIAQISDLHNQRFGPNQSRLLELVRMAHPDLIAITGDLTYHGRWSSDYVCELARGLVEIAPVYFVTGNHDVSSRNLLEMLKLLEGLGVKVLAGRSVAVQRCKQSIVIAGIDDPYIFYDKRKPAIQAVNQWKTSLAALRNRIPRGSYTILLSHRPELIGSYAELGFDLVLAGHAHGGQVRLPFIGALYAPDQGLFPRYTSGTYSMGRTKMIVSRGLGKSNFPFRIFNRPELVVVRLTSPTA